MSLTLPDFYIAGVQKCGTTSLRFMLQSNPIISFPVGNEVHWFDKDEKYKKGLEIYAKKFETAKGKGKIVGDKTPCYVNSSKTIKRIHDATPDAKIILLLRDPTARWFSNYFHRHSLNRKDKYQWFWDHMDGLHRGNYYDRLTDLFEHFDPKQVYIEFTERMRVNTRERVSLILKWLGAKDEARFYKRKRHRPWKYNEEWKKKVNDYYRPMLPKLKELLRKNGFDFEPVDQWCKD